MIKKGGRGASFFSFYISIAAVEKRTSAFHSSKSLNFGYN